MQIPVYVSCICWIQLYNVHMWRLTTCYCMSSGHIIHIEHELNMTTVVLWLQAYYQGSIIQPVLAYILSCGYNQWLRPIVPTWPRLTNNHYQLGWDLTLQTLDEPAWQETFGTVNIPLLPFHTLQYQKNMMEVSAHSTHFLQHRWQRWFEGTVIKMVPTKKSQRIVKNLVPLEVRQILFAFLEILKWQCAKLELV